MNTRFRIALPRLHKLSKHRHRGFVLGICFVAMSVIMLLCSILLLISSVDAKTTKRDRALFETESEITVIGMDFVTGRIDFLATKENGDALYPLNGNYRAGSYNEKYRLWLIIPAWPQTLSQPK